ncbi:hypothetical protein [Streptomyces sp. SID12488]|uniref:hypothetical protein n=1 Tax=Streptomyces sp. SID12488 TaxID=2706040 RepID=UPI0013DBCB02|nr:hypothetical protein [Streptomyces sp. SID12488]NEA67538.1 hypothetical protein [Streptomyces sp. SID12488]
MPVPSETAYGPIADVADWLRANGIDPNDVPHEGPITIDGQCIRYAALLRNEDGHRYVDQATGDAAREERTASLKVEPPEKVQVRSAI